MNDLYLASLSRKGMFLSLLASKNFVDETLIVGWTLNFVKNIKRFTCTCQCKRKILFNSLDSFCSLKMAKQM